MTPKQLTNIEDVFHRALELSGEARVRFLADACGDNEALRREIESLLEYKERTQSPLKAPVVDEVFRALAEADGETLIGKTVSHYQILSRVAEGGMGQVYAALDQRLNRKVALKFLPVSFMEDENQVRRLQHEARAASALNHPNIVTVYEFGQADSRRFIVMEFVEGVTLRQKLPAPMPFREVINVAIQVASGLAAAHQAGILHRDIKPENVMTGNEGFVKVLDFGIAKFKERHGPSEVLSVVNTEASVAAGTLSYMSPEQARGEALDARTDIFSLGVLLFEMITGKKPFGGETQTEILHSLVHDEAPSLATHRRDAPPDLQRIVGKALRKNPDDRYQSAKEMLADLREFDRVAGRELDDTQRANRMLRQYLSIYAVDKRALIPITKLRFIRRYSDLEKGERTRELFKKSLRWGLIKASLMLVSLLLVTIVAAAVLSRREEWTGIRLSDGHTAAVRRAVFSPDGRLLVSVGEDKRVIVWNFALRKRIATLTDHLDWVTCITFSPDGKWFATGSRDTTVIVWETARLQKVAVLRDHHGEIRSIAFSPNGRFLASASYIPDNRTIVWAVDHWKNIREFPGGSGNANLMFSPDSKQLVSAWGDGDTWDVATGQEVHAGEKDSVGNWRAPAPGAKGFVNVLPDGWVYFWDTQQFWQSGEHKLLEKRRAHHDDARAAAFSPDGRLVATGAEDIILWEATTQTIITHFKHAAIVWSVEFSPDGRWLVSTHGDGAILLWNVAERDLAGNFNEHSGPVRSVAYSSDEKHIASASEDGTVVVWDAASGRKEATLVGHDARTMAVVFSPDGRWVASIDFYRNLIRWDIDRSQPKWTIDSRGTGRTLAISPNAHWIAATSGVFDSQDGHEVADFYTTRPELSEIYGVVFSANGRWLACAGATGSLYLVDTGSWQVLEHLQLSDTQLIAVSFSPDSKSLVTGDDEGRVRLWSVSPLREVALIGRHAARVKSVAFSPDGQEVASAGDDRNIYVWDVAKRRSITSIGTHTAPVLSVAFSPDGKKLVAGGQDNSVRVFTRRRALWGYNLD
jgi:eukaryotic-like serine/threonine-protein kinase